jgi:hypothetical protein
LVWQSPSNSASFFPEDEVTIGWNVKNTGTAPWDVGSVEFMYIGGLKPHDDERMQLQTSVAPGEDIVLSAHMIAPRNSTRYTTRWSLRQGDTFFCSLMASFYVTEY